MRGNAGSECIEKQPAGRQLQIKARIKGGKARIRRESVFSIVYVLLSIVIHQSTVYSVYLNSPGSLTGRDFAVFLTLTTKRKRDYYSRLESREMEEP